MKSILALWTPVILLALAAGIPAASAATVTLTPDSGLAGETIQVDDSGWLTDDTKTVSIVELATDVATLASVDGVFTGTFSVPDTSVGVYTVRVSDGTESVDAALTVAAEANRTRMATAWPTRSPRRSPFWSTARPPPRSHLR